MRRSPRKRRPPAGAAASARSRLAHLLRHPRAGPDLGRLRQRRRRHHHLVGDRRPLRLQHALAAAAHHAHPGRDAGDGRPHGRRHRQGSGGADPREVQPQGDGLRDARPPGRQLRHHRRGVLGRRRRLQPRPHPAVAGRAAGGRRRVAARDARQLPQGRARLPRAHGACYVAYFVAGVLAQPDWASGRPRHRRAEGPDQQPVAAHGRSPPSAPRSRPGASSSSRPTSSTSASRSRGYVYTKVEVYLGRRVHRRHRPVHRPRLRRDALQDRYRRGDGRRTRPGRWRRSPAEPRRSSSASACSTCRSWEPASCRSPPPTPSARPSASRAGSTRSGATRRSSTAC